MVRKLATSMAAMVMFTRKGSKACGMSSPLIGVPPPDQRGDQIDV
jgi:hypothetical protein